MSKDNRVMTDKDVKLMNVLEMNVFVLTTTDWGISCFDYTLAKDYMYSAGGAAAKMTVVAKTEIQAREMAADAAGDEGPEAWLDERTLCVKASSYTTPVVLGRD